MKKVIHCLLVDDDMDDREIFLMVLESISDQIKCDTAPNGVEALRMLKDYNSNTLDFIFLDVNMPKMNGLETLAQIRQNEDLDGCKIFMYSTTVEPNIMEKSKALHAGFIVKPINLGDLKDILSTILQPD